MNLLYLHIQEHQPCVQEHYITYACSTQNATFDRMFLNARLIDAPEFSGYASTAMTLIAACNQNDETNTSHSELEENDDDSHIMLRAAV